MLGFEGYRKSREQAAWDVLKATRCGRICTLEIEGYGSGGLKPTAVQASLVVVLFARNKEFFAPLCNERKTGVPRSRTRSTEDRFASVFLKPVRNSFLDCKE